MSEKVLRCLWCNGSEGELIRVELENRQMLQAGISRQVANVHPEHQEELRAFHSQVEREGSRFLKRVLLLMMTMAGLEVGLVLWRAPLAVTGIGIAVSCLGLLMVRYPFPTPLTVQLFGVRRALRLVRICGYALLLLGLALMIVGVCVQGDIRGNDARHSTNSAR